MSMLDGIFRIESVSRSPERQAEVDAETSRLTLYHFEVCPFCRRVRAAIERLALNIELRDTRRDPGAYRELLEGGGRTMVPCLRIDHGHGQVEWMYESTDIVAYLNRRFGE